MNELDIQLIVNPACELVAIDRTSYQNLHYQYGGELQYLRDRSKHVSIEFLTNVDGEVLHNTINLEEGLGMGRRVELLDGNTSVFYFPYDGTFTYYKLLIPDLSFLVKKDYDTNEDVLRADNQLFYYDKKFYYCDNIEEEVFMRDFPSWGDAYDYVLSKSKVLSINELWGKQGTQTFSFQKILFSICKLQKCLVDLQKQIISNPENCSECGMESSLRFKRDFLLSALYVFDYLKDTKNYEEAQRILDNMNGCGGFLCNNTATNKTDCGCGKAIY
jgi:hypothetical protein